MSDKFNRMQLARDHSLPPDTSAYDDAVESAINTLIEQKTIDYLDGKVDSKTWEVILKVLSTDARDIVNQDIEDERWERKNNRDI